MRGVPTAPCATALAAAVSVLIGLAAPAAAAPLFGYNDNAVRAGRIGATSDAQLTERSGANVTRLTFDWRWVEPQKGVRRFAAYDEIYRAMRARGIRPLLILMFAPWWAWDAGVSCNQWTRECRYPPAREHYADWRSIAAELARRYPEAAGIEVWNEPNIASFWRPGPDPVRYVKLLGETYRAVKAVAPNMPVVSGGLANPATVPGVSLSSVSFLKAMYQNGARPYMDGIGVHPYPGRIDSGPGSPLRRNMADWRFIRDWFGDVRKPFWATELGLSSSRPNPAMRLREDQQADGLRSAYRALAGMPDVKAVFVHELVQAGNDRTVVESGYGVVRPDLRPRKAYCALARERGRTPCG
jgi:polysaccharide biosynthesis protein PslG